jgi:hypothetical protein
LQTRRLAKAIVVVERDFENGMAVTNGFAADEAFHRGPGMIDFSHSCCLARQSRCKFHIQAIGFGTGLRLSSMLEFMLMCLMSDIKRSCTAQVGGVDRSAGGVDLTFASGRCGSVRRTSESG